MPIVPMLNPLALSIFSKGDAYVAQPRLPPLFYRQWRKREMKIATLRRALELNEFMRPCIECASNLYKHINTDVGRSRLNLPEVGPADTRHEGKLPLRDALRSAQLADLSAQTSLFACILHSLSMRTV